MQKKRPLSTLVLAVLGLATCLEASAIGFGQAPQGAVLGQPLDFVVSLRLESGETLSQECISAEVTLGEQRLPPGSVRATLEERGPGSTLIRVATSPAIDEPVVTVQLEAGCTARVSRRFVLLADPPSTSLPAPALMVLVADTAGTTGAAQAQPAAPVDQPPPRSAEAAPAPASRPAVTRSSAARPAMPVVRVVAKTEPPRATDAKRERKPVAAPPPAVAESLPRLRLDAAEPPAAPDAAMAAAVEDALQAVDAAASAARAAAVAASASAQRIALLERTVEQLRTENATQRAASQGAADAGSRWFTPLLLAVLALLGLAGWLALQLRAARLSRQQAWYRAAAAEAPPGNQTAPIPLVTSEIEFPPPRPQVRPAWPAPVSTPELTAPIVASALAASAVPVFERPAVAMVERTEVLTPQVPAEQGAARDVSIDELLDLEQQADFFVALGQDEAAVDLLVDHLRGTGGGSPLPYLKLLEVYRRRDDRDAYERTRTRFNDRFNAYAPEWESDLQGGRTLDDYPGLVKRLQQVWPRPLDAMAELEALLFRKSRGDLFDLPAYREVLFLYSLARDLLEREPAELTQVDLLLPLADGGEFSSTAPGPFVVVDPAQANEPPGGRATEPVDLELFGDSSSAFGDIFGKPGPQKKL